MSALADTSRLIDKQHITTEAISKWRLGLLEGSQLSINMFYLFILYINV